VIPSGKRWFACQTIYISQFGGGALTRRAATERACERSGGAAQRLDATAGAEPPRVPATMVRGWAHARHGRRHETVISASQSSLVAVPVLVGLFEALVGIEAEGWGVVAHDGEIGVGGALLAAPLEEAGYQTATQALVTD
jgi:hypothetical protein